MHAAYGDVLRAGAGLPMVEWRGHLEAFLSLLPAQPVQLVLHEALREPRLQTPAPLALVPSTSWVPGVTEARGWGLSSLTTALCVKGS